MKHIKRIYISIFSWVPGPALFAVFRSLYDAFTPAMVTLVSVGLFDSSAKVLLNAHEDPTSLYFYAGLYLLVYLINDLLGFASSIIIQCWVYEKCTSFFRMDLYDKFAKLPLISMENADLLNRKERVNYAVNNEELSSIFQRTLAILKNAIAVASVALVMAQYSLWLLPLSLLSVLPYLYARIKRGKEFFYLRQIQAKKMRLQNYLWDLFTTKQTAKEMRVIGFDGYITDLWHSVRDEVNEEIWAQKKKDAVSLLWCDGVRISGYCVSIVVVLRLVLHGDITLGVFGGALTAFLSLQNSMKVFLSDLGRITEHLAHAADYYSFIDMPEEMDGIISYSGLHSAIELVNISFKYPNSENYALNSLNLTIRKGEIIAILGENGCGKTTLSKVLLGLYPSESGQVLFDGIAVEKFEKSSFYAQISSIAQDFVSYNLTLRENVAISDLRKSCNDHDIEKTLANAGFDEEIDLDDMMGREFGGRELSGGQWQKLAIARGLFRDSKLIVLDEPTSALDPLIETEILSKFIEAAAGKTALIISHRVGLCKLVDRIIVMREGEIIEDGTHDVLLAAGGEYAHLYRSQAKWYG